MRSSTSNFDYFGRAGWIQNTPGKFIGIIFAIVLAGLGGCEFVLRNYVQNVDDTTARYVNRAFFQQGTDILIGDSHTAGGEAGVPSFTFLGRGGLTPEEIENVVKFYYRDKPGPGRLILVLGPNSFSNNRQQGGASLPWGSFAFQVLPFRIYLFEGAYRTQMTSSLRSAFLELEKSDKAENKKDEDESTQAGSLNAKDARKQAMARWWAKRKETGEAFNIGMLDPEDERLLAAGRFKSQNPVKNFQNSPAFLAVERLLDWAKAEAKQICIVDTPLSPVYAGIVNADKNSRFGEVRKVLGEVTAKRGFKFFSGTEQFPGLPVEFFQDQDHLNIPGQKKLWTAVQNYCFS
jgi:hypothetical protein